MSGAALQNAPRRRAGRPSAGESEDLERAVLEAALAEFRLCGYSGASIERMARQAGVTRSAIYRRYGGRRALFQLVIDAQIALLEAEAGNLIRLSSDPLDALRRTAEAYCHFVVSPVSLDLQRIVIWETGAKTAVMPRIAAVPTSLSAPLDRLIAAAQAEGKLRAGPVETWRDVLLRLAGDGPRWLALAGGKPLDKNELKADFERMWGVFMTLARAGDDV